MVQCFLLFVLNLTYTRHCTRFWEKGNEKSKVSISIGCMNFVLIFSRGSLRISWIFTTLSHGICFMEKWAKEKVLIFSVLEKKRKALFSLTSFCVFCLCWLTFYDAVILTVMVDFMCQLDWRPDIWSNIFLVISMRVVLDDIYI